MTSSQVLHTVELYNSFDFPPNTLSNAFLYFPVDFYSQTYMIKMNYCTVMFRYVLASNHTSLLFSKYCALCQRFLILRPLYNMCQYIESIHLYTINLLNAIF